MIFLEEVVKEGIDEMPHAYLNSEVDEHYLLEIEVLCKVSCVLLITREQ